MSFQIRCITPLVQTRTRFCVLSCLIALASQANAEAVCRVRFDLGPELVAAASREYWTAYIHQTVHQVNFLFRGKVPTLRIAVIADSTVGAFASAEALLAYYASLEPATDGPVCANVFMGHRRFVGSDVVGIAHVGSACDPGHAAVFNVESTHAMVQMSNWTEINTGAWWHRDNTALVLGHEMLHVYGVQHTENPADIMYYRAAVSEMPQHLVLNASASVPCTVNDAYSSSNTANAVIFASLFALLSIAMARPYKHGVI